MSDLAFPRPRLRWMSLAVPVVVLLALLPTAAARATPSPSELEEMIDAKWRQLEPVVEQYNKVHSRLQANRKKVAALEKKIEPLSLQTKIALANVAELAAGYYKAGRSSYLNALLTTGSPTTLADQLAMLDRLARERQEQIAKLTAMRDKYDAEKRKLDALVKHLREQDAELAAKKKEIDAEIKRLQRLLDNAGPRITVDVGECPEVTAVGDAAIAVKTACAQLGDPYVWGANGPDAFDCSGLTQYAWGKAGVHLTHYTGAQWEETRSVSSSEARAGDLVFFYSDLHHVGLYLGDGLMVHASRPGQPVKVAEVRYMPVAGYRRPG